MAAAAFVAVLVFRTSSGQGYTQRCTVSDVANAYYTFQDGSSDLTLPNAEWVALQDVQLSAAGTDTTKATIFCNQRETGEQIQNALNLATAGSGRQYSATPIYFAGGSRIKIRQDA